MAKHTRMSLNTSVKLFNTLRCGSLWTRPFLCKLINQSSNGFLRQNHQRPFIIKREFEWRAWYPCHDSWQPERQSETDCTGPVETRCGPHAAQFLRSSSCQRLVAFRDRESAALRTDLQRSGMLVRREHSKKQERLKDYIYEEDVP